MKHGIRVQYAVVSIAVQLCHKMGVFNNLPKLGRVHELDGPYRSQKWSGPDPKSEWKWTPLLSLSGIVSERLDEPSKTGQPCCCADMEGHVFTNWAETCSCRPELYFEPQTHQGLRQVRD